MNAEAQKRVELAKDVIKQINAKLIKPAKFRQYITDLHTDPKTGATVCEVCAAGALVVACCGIDGVRGMNAVHLDEYGVAACLSPLFSLRQLALIEAAYEISNEMPLATGYSLDCDDAEERRAFYREVDTAAQMFADGGIGAYLESTSRFLPLTRMAAIMQNIVDNDGEFKPVKKYNPGRRKAS